MESALRVRHVDGLTLEGIKRFESDPWIEYIKFFEDRIQSVRGRLYDNTKIHRFNPR